MNYFGARQHLTATAHGDLDVSNTIPYYPQGIGSARCLHIYAAPASERASTVSREAKQLWEWAQAEGGAYWNYSQHEIGEMLEPGGVVDPHLQVLRNRRCVTRTTVSADQCGNQSHTIGNEVYLNETVRK